MKKILMLRFRQPTDAPDDNCPSTFLANNYTMFLSDDGFTVSVTDKRGITNLYPFASVQFIRIDPGPSGTNTVAKK